MARLHVLAGLPGAGKSTRARSLAGATGAAIVARDELRAGLVSVRDEALLTLLLADMARSLLEHGHDVVVDAWNLHPDDRRRWECMAFLAGAELVWELVATPVDECVRRDAGRPSPNGEAAVRAAAAAFPVALAA